MVEEYKSLISVLFSNEFIFKSAKNCEECDSSSDCSDISIDNDCSKKIFDGLACIENSLNKIKVCFFNFLISKKKF